MGGGRTGSKWGTNYKVHLRRKWLPLLQSRIAIGALKNSFKSRTPVTCFISWSLGGFDPESAVKSDLGLISTIFSLCGGGHEQKGGGLREVYGSKKQLKLRNVLLAGTWEELWRQPENLNFSFILKSKILVILEIKLGFESVQSMPAGVFKVRHASGLVRFKILVLFV